MPIQTSEVLHDRYHIIKPIGRGGMASIFLAEDRRLKGRQCAIKEVSGDPEASLETREQTRNQFYREASTLARLDHPNLPKVSDFFSDDQADMLVMDYVPGEDLRSITNRAIRENRFLPTVEVLAWTRQLIDALSYLHSQKPPIVHRDVKPANVRLTPSGLIKLVDFGLVKLISPDERTITVVQGHGTAHYTPLEQYGGDTGHTTLQTDIYALGATMYCLLTNEPPAEAKVRFLNAKSLPMIRDINPHVSARIERAVHWALGLHPEDRPLELGAFQDALYSGIIDIPDRLPDFVPELPIELWAQTLSDPIQRNMTLIAGLLIILAIVSTLAAQ